ncbi:MAG TPA: polysaccharide biosynthesis/export family protein [Candidatus Omnitrophota bacterium]|nr:polysaccharide biosynthesis/export family protein [Candidatus Omnitrophota bacterium]HPD85168.1 polysaccharide biosynthesis/export family protein [Candidatus Omnitrophota bacterium]HRZ04331.1 polysaccharide biosynthesis/export family protein [Candidatus Omnitrophota bacterium]
MKKRFLLFFTLFACSWCIVLACPMLGSAGIIAAESANPAPAVDASGDVIVPQEAAVEPKTEAALEPLPEMEEPLKVIEQPLEDMQLRLGDASKYTLGVGDVVEIKVLRHLEVSGEYTINNEGKIQYEFVGDIKAVGLTKDDLKKQLEELLAKYIISPEVTVKITGYNSKVVYLIGEVNIPGKIAMKGDTITVREALVLAGLPTLGAASRKCRLITPADAGKATIKYVNVYELLYSGDLRENYVMKPGDTLYIPATVMTKAMRVISPVTQPVSAAAGAGSAVTGF